jgi:hypothetical protein
VETCVGVFQADAYKATPDAIDETLIPYNWYRDLVLAGAREHGFSAEYIAHIESFAVEDDPDTEREKRNRDILKG